MLIYKHYIITYFNCYTEYSKYYVGIDDYNEIAKFLNSSEYLDKRFNIFEKYTVPSIKSQINHNFSWIVVFNECLPLKYRNKIKKIKEKIDIIDLYYGDEEFDFKKYTEVNDKEYNIFLTTRLDNDDMLNEKFVEFVQNNIDENCENMMLTFENGIRLDISSNLQFKYKFVENHFLSLLHNNDKNVYNYIHWDFSDYDVPVKRIDNQNPLWVEIVHDTNVINNNFFNDWEGFYNYNYLIKSSLKDRIMKKIKIITINFEKFDDSFYLYLKGVKNNPTIDFMLFTDKKVQCNIPNNLEIKYLTLEQFNFKTSEIVPLEIENFNYKLIYPMLFNEYLKDYQYFGYCGINVLLGNIRNFLDKKHVLIEKYDKIFLSDNFSIYKIKDDFYNNLLNKNYDFFSNNMNEINFKYVLNFDDVGEFTKEYEYKINNDKYKNKSYIFKCCNDKIIGISNDNIYEEFAYLVIRNNVHYDVCNYDNPILITPYCVKNCDTIVDIEKELKIL